MAASTAISRELCENYDGSPILRQHATYLDFLRVANDEEKTYFSFSCIRNPLDVAVSNYLKYVSDHKGIFRDSWGRRNFLYYHLITRRRYAFIKNANADFQTYFMRFHRIPYNNWSSLSHRDLNFIMRFENLQDDFAKVLKLLGIKEERPLPWENMTAGKGKDFLSHYTPGTFERAKRVFGPFMKQWDYEFPSEWGDESTPWLNKMLFDFANIFRNLYWIYLRPRVYANKEK